MLFRKFNQSRSDSLIPEEIIDIEFCDLISFDMDHSLHDPVVIDKDVIKNFR